MGCGFHSPRPGSLPAGAVFTLSLSGFPPARRSKEDEPSAGAVNRVPTVSKGDGAPSQGTRQAHDPRHVRQPEFSADFSAAVSHPCPLLHCPRSAWEAALRCFSHGSSTLP